MGFPFEICVLAIETLSDAHDLARISDWILNNQERELEMFEAYRSRTLQRLEQPTSASESSEATAIIAPEEPINVSETINSRSPSPQKSLVQRIQLLDNRHNQNLSAFCRRLWERDLNGIRTRGIGLENSNV